MEVLKQNSVARNKLLLLIRIDDFPAFVASKARCFTRDINVNNIWWYIGICMDKWNDLGEYITITPETPDQPDDLNAYIRGSGVGNISNDRSFDVTAIFKFKHPGNAEEIKLTDEFCFNSSNGYEHAGRGTAKTLAEIDVLFNFSLC